MQQKEVSVGDSKIWLWKVREQCRLCNSADLETRLELPPMSIATTNFHHDRLEIDESDFSAPVPLPLVTCSSCGLLQVSVVGNPEIQYRDYAYTTKLSVGLPEHFVKTSGYIVRKLGLGAGDTVLEFGSNDGTYLRAFREHGLTVLGIDPARAIAKKAEQAGVPTYAEFFDIPLAERIIREHGQVDLLVANNVIANIDDLGGVFRAVRALLGKTGVFAFETQYGRDILDRFLLDTVYHEHLTYFNVAPLMRVLDRFELEIFDVERIPTKGGSIRVYVQCAGGERAISPNVAELIQAEVSDGVETQQRFDRFSADIAERRDRIHEIICQARSEGGPIAGYGVSIGTSAMLGQLDLIRDIDFLVDDDTDKPPYLVGPGYRISVKPTSSLVAENVKLTVVFAWRYTESIVKSNADYRGNGGEFLVPLPSPHTL